MLAAAPSDTDHGCHCMVPFEGQIGLQARANLFLTTHNLHQDKGEVVNAATYCTMLCISLPKQA